MFRKLCGFTIAVAIAFAVPAFGQLDSGTFSGRVTDPSAATVPNAAVSVVNTSTNFVSDTKTNGEGLYEIPSLRPGTYRMSVTAQGFKQAVHDGLELHVGEKQEVNVTVEIGVASESVHVTGEVAQLQTENSAGGQTLEGAYLEQLPLYQRYVASVYYLTPNVSTQGIAYSGNLNGFHIDGLSDTKVGFFQDGVYASASDNGTVYTAQTIQSTVEEVKVLSTILPAEYGHSGGGALTSVQRTGTNSLHGEISEFGRVSAMQERKYFDEYRFGQPQPGLTNAPSELFQQPNATLSGPVYIPKIYHGKNKTFFLFAVERVIEKQGKQQAYTVPDANELAGNFSFAGNGGPAANQLYDPLSTALVGGKYQRTPIPGNIIPQSRIDPVALKFLSLNPWAPPNTAGTYGNTGPSNNFNGTYLKKYFSENYTGRLDQQFTPTFKMYGNWLYKSIYQRSPNPQISQPLFDSSLVQSHDYNNTATLGATKILSPTIVNELKIGYNRFIDEVTSPDENMNTAQLLGIPNVLGAELPGGLPLSVGGPSKNVVENFTFKDDVSWVKNKHSFKFGYDWLHMRQDQWSVGSPSGTFSFDGAAGLTGSGTTTIPNTGGISLASFMLGSVTSYGATIPTASWLPRENISSVYFQDDWKITPKLTLNIGTRWVMESPWHTKYGQFAVFNPTASDDVVKGDTGSTVHPGGNMTNREWQRPEPRFGLSWHPESKLVVRTGFALMHIDRGLAPSELSEYSISASQNEPSGNPTPFFQIHNGPQPLNFPALTGNGYLPYVGCTTGTLNGVTFPTCASRSAVYIDPNLKNPYSMTWTFAIQYQLMQNTLVELSYDGSASVGNIESPNENVLPMNFDAGNATALAAVAGNGQVYRPWVNFGTISYMTNVSHSTYHAGTVHVQKRLAHGLLYDSFFTYSKSLDGSGVGVTDIASILYKGPSSFDRRFHYAGNFSYNIPMGKGQRFLNRGGVLDGVLGGYTLVWQYDAYSGNPVTPGYTNSPNTGPPSVIGGITGRPNLIGDPSMANDWQNLGNDRFNQAGYGVNSSVCCLSDFAYPAAYTFGNEGKGVLYVQRTIGASFSLRKEFTLHERAKIQIRLDYQNPFKWYTLGNPGTTVDLKNVVAGAPLTSPAAELPGNAFGKLSSGNEGTTVADGGVPMMNGTIKFTF
ncbi:MAG TPA: carboxypeptidase-like regulatory domain-containing protein [Bryobacteraceae bacterium]|nr:carboxypeptidase-like regulatory domain-containing protein [Bryobacteraceae bacterium]